MGIMDELKKIKNSQEEIKPEPSITERLDNVGKGVNPPLPMGGVEGRPLDPPIKRELPKKEKVEKKEKQACPTCGKGFVHLSRHKCDTVPPEIKPTKAAYEPPKAEEVDIFNMVGGQLDTLGGSSFPREGMTDEEYRERLLPLFFPTLSKEKEEEKKKFERALDDLAEQEIKFELEKRLEPPGTVTPETKLEVKKIQEQIKEELKEVQAEINKITEGSIVTDYARGLEKRSVKKKFPTFDIAVDVVPIKLEDVRPFFLCWDESSLLEIRNSDECAFWIIERFEKLDHCVIVVDSENSKQIRVLSFFVEYARNVFVGSK